MNLTKGIIMGLKMNFKLPKSKREIHITELDVGTDKLQGLVTFF